MLDRALLSEKYRGLTDEDIERLVLEELGELHADALPKLKEELDRRRRNELARIVAAQMEDLGTSQFEALFAWFRNSPCPSCGSAVQPLNACPVQTVGRRVIVAGCPECLKEAIDDASKLERGGCLLGLFGFSTVGARAGLRDLPEHLAAFRPEPTEALLTYVEDHRGQLLVAMRDAAASKGSARA